MSDEKIELIQSAEANLDNLATMVPGLSEHPMFKIVKMQIAEALKQGSGE